MAVELLDHQKERIGRLIWTSIDGVAKYVMPVLIALNADTATGIRIVAHEEWARCLDWLQTLQPLLAELESKTVEYSRDRIIGRMRKILTHDPLSCSDS